jgi:hypothetical protein
MSVLEEMIVEKRRQGLFKKGRWGGEDQCRACTLLIIA